MLGPFLWQGLGVNESMGAVSGKAELCALFGCGKSRNVGNSAPLGTPIGAGQARHLSRLAAQRASRVPGFDQSPCGRVPSIDHDDACRPLVAPLPPPATGMCPGADCPDKSRRPLPLSPCGGQPKGLDRCPLYPRRAMGRGTPVRLDAC